MAQSVVTEEWVLGPEGTPFYTKRVRILFPISPTFFPLVEKQLISYALVVPKHRRDQSLYSLCSRLF